MFLLQDTAKGSPRGNLLLFSYNRMIFLSGFQDSQEFVFGAMLNYFYHPQTDHL